eukprot:scaffold2775_cov343-Prasinococcus_capsulatus_cf.AAC.9
MGSDVVGECGRGHLRLTHRALRPAGRCGAASAVRRPGLGLRHGRNPRAARVSVVVSPRADGLPALAKLGARNGQEERRDATPRRNTPS